MKRGNPCTLPATIALIALPDCSLVLRILHTRKLDHASLLRTSQTWSIAPNNQITHPQLTSLGQRTHIPNTSIFPWGPVILKNAQSQSGLIPKHSMGLVNIYIYICVCVVPPKMSTSFGSDWYLQCVMHIFVYKKSNKKTSTSQFKKQ